MRMPELPLFQRELSAFGKGPFFFALRAAPACLTLAFGMLFVMFTGGVISPMRFEGFGAIVASACLAFQYTVALIGAPLWAAGFLAKEREDRTLPLLVLADFRGGDILLAKFAGSFGAAALLCGATAPLLVMAATGRVALEAVVFATAHSVVLAAFGAALGLYCALRNGGESNGGRFAVAAAVSYGAIAVAVSRWSFAMEAPFPFLFWGGFAFLDFDPIAPFILALCVPAFLAVLTLFLAHRRLPYAVEPSRPAAVRTRRRDAVSNAPPAVQERVLLRRIWLGPDVSGSGRFGLILANLALFAVSAIPFIGNGVVAIVLAYRLCIRNRRLLNNPVIDELRLTHESDAVFQKAVFKAMIQDWAGRGLLFLGTFALIVVVNPTLLLGMDSHETRSNISILALVAGFALLAVWQSLCLSVAAAAFSCNQSSITVQTCRTVAFYGLGKFMAYVLFINVMGVADSFAVFWCVSMVALAFPLTVVYVIARSVFHDQFLVRLDVFDHAPAASHQPTAEAAPL